MHSKIGGIRNTKIRYYLQKLVRNPPCTVPSSSDSAINHFLNRDRRKHRYLPEVVEVEDVKDFEVNLAVQHPFLGI
jgi:hypothetical protein